MSDSSLPKLCHFYFLACRTPGFPWAEVSDTEFSNRADAEEFMRDFRRDSPELEFRIEEFPPRSMEVA